MRNAKSTILVVTWRSATRVEETFGPSRGRVFVRGGLHDIPSYIYSVRETWSLLSPIASSTLQAIYGDWGM
jgi:hypothetical protein